ncbi:ESPR-type extended signal peptide-containing protein, partial [Actinobacillus suis]
MNKIFKVIWNHTTQTFVVTSELSKAKGKSSSTDERTNTKNLLALGTLGSVVLGSALIPTIAEAAVAIGSASTAGAYAAAISGDAAVNYNNPGSLSYDNPNRTRTGSDLYSPIDNIGDVEATGIAIGNQSSALAANYQNLASGIAIGDYAKASGPLSTALGHFSIASGTGAMAQGTASRASGFNSLSIMRQSAATSAYAMAIGTASWADGVSSLAVGQSATSKGKQSIAIGSADVAATATTDGRGGTAYASNYSTNHTDSSGDYSIAIGTIAKSGASNSTAIGYNANATGGSSFALGVNSKTEKDNSIAIGNQSKALNADTIAAGRQAIANASSAMAFGLQANSSGVSSIAIGESANVATTGVSAIALGTRANADKQGAVSIGLKSNATADQAIAIGELSKATANDTVAIGSTTNATARDAIAIGTNNNVTACYSVAIGSNNKVVQEETYVLGTNIVSTQANSVILGSLSKDRAATTENSATINGITYENFAGQGRSGNGIVSIGQEGAERQLINVAAGKISETSTDAINGSQLYVVANKLSEGWVIANGTKVGDVKLNNQVNFLAGNANTNVEVKANGTTGIYDVVISALNTASTAAGIEYYSVNSTVAENKDNKGATAANAMAAGPKASATGNESIAIGYNSTASSVSATAMGDSSLASGGLSTAIGTSATSTGLAATSIGVLAKATADGANAMGFEATASNNNTVAVGTSSLASGTESTALGYNSTASAQNTVALGSDSIANATSALAVGVGATATADSAVAIGNDSNAMGDSSVAIGESSNATGTYATAVGDTSNATGDRSVAFGIDSKAINASTAAIGDNATATQDNSVALGSGTTTEAAVNTDSATVNGITYSGFAGNTAHSVVSVGNGNQKRQIQNVAAGRISATSTDAINGSQLYVVANNLTDAIKIANNTANTANNTANAANATANKGWNITTAKVGSGNVVGTLVDNIQLGETVTVEAGDNINITQSANKISIATSATPTFTTVTTQNFNAKPNGNINMGGNVVTNVAAPVNDTDAANKQYVDNGRTKVKSDNNSVKVVYDQASNTYDLAVDVVPTVNLQDGKNTKVNNTGTTYSIDAWNTTAKAGSTEVNVTSEVNSTTNTIDYTIDLSDSAKNNITTANSVANQANSTANTANTTVNKGWNITTSGNATGTEDKNVQMGDKVTIDGGENIQITQEGTKISIATSKTPTFTNVTVGDTKINNDGITINNGPSITNNGIDAADKPITNVANGTNATDAVNVQQLNASKAAVLKGLNTAVTTSTNATTGGTDYTVNAWNTTAKAGSTEVNVTSEVNSTTNTIDYTIDLSDSAKNNITTANSVANQANTTANTALQTVVTQIDGTDVKTITKDSNKANFITGDNIVLTADNEGIKIATSKTPTFTNVTVGDTKIDTDGVTINNGPSMTKDGINAGDKVISNVAAGTKPTDAVNVKQLTDNVTNVTNNINNVSNEVAKGWNITTSASQGSVTGNSTEQINMGELVTIDAGKNINITQTAGKISIATSDKPTFTTAAVGNTSLNGDDIKLGNTTINGNGLTINNGPSITNEGIDAADKPITNVANGVNGTDAVNLNQLNETKAAITTTVTSDDKSITVKENLTNGRIYDISVAQAEVVTNPNGTTANNKAGNTFVTGDNLVNVLNNTSFNVTSGSVDSGKVSGTTAEQVKAGETVTFKAGNNLVLAQDGQNFTYSLSNTLDLTDKGSIKLGNTTITDNNVTVGGVSVTDKGINAANNTISNVKDGEVSATSKDAVNGSQLYTTNQNVTNVTNTVNKGWNITTSASNGSAEGTSLTNVKMGDTVTIDAGKNINITQTAGKISIATSDNPTFSNVTVGDTKIN